MNPSLTDAIKEAYAMAPADKSIIETLEIRQTGSASIFIHRGFSTIDLRLETGNTVTFQPVGFEFKLPKNSDTGGQSLQISIDNTDAAISDFVQNAKSSRQPVQVLYRPYLSSDLTTPQMNPPLTLYLKNVSINSNTVTAQATFVDVVNKRFPNEYYTPDRFPGLS